MGADVASRPLSALPAKGKQRIRRTYCRQIRWKSRKQQYRPPEWGAEVNPLSRGLHDPERVSGGDSSVRLPEASKAKFLAQFRSCNQALSPFANRLAGRPMATG